jgi:hypothetical protein
MDLSSTPRRSAAAVAASRSMCREINGNRESTGAMVSDVIAVGVLMPAVVE